MDFVVTFYNHVKLLAKYKIQEFASTKLRISFTWCCDKNGCLCTMSSPENERKTVRWFTEIMLTFISDFKLLMRLEIEFQRNGFAQQLQMCLLVIECFMLVYDSFEIHPFFVRLLLITYVNKCRRDCHSIHVWRQSHFK